MTQEIPMPLAYKKIGTMENTSEFTGEVLKITVSRDDHSVIKTARIPKGSYTLAQVAGYLLSAWLLPSLTSAKDIALIIFGNAILTETLNLVATKEVVGTVSDYTWKGVPSNTSKGKTGYLEGYKVDYKDKNGKAKTYKKDYLPSAWKTDTFGRMMFYTVYKIEVHPTKWY